MIFQFEDLIYNDFPFPVESKLEIQFDPKYDRADRAVVAVSHMLNVTVTLKTDTLVGLQVNGQALTGVNEHDLPIIKAALMAPGQALTLTGTGFGNLSVNGGLTATGGVSDKKDSAWGPKPRRCSFLPLGTTACVLRWTCEVFLPTCLDAVFENKLMAYNYSVSVSIDEQGYCTRTVHGYFEIPLPRAQGGGKAVTQSGLDYWNATTQPGLPDGFRRTQIEATESDDRRKVNFHVVDTEVNDVILPPNVVDCRANHTVVTADKALVRMIATLRASYTLRKGVPKQDAFTYFLIMLYEKWINQVQNRPQGVAKQSIIPIAMTMEDPDIYGRQAGNFSCTWSYVNGPIKAVDNKQFDPQSAKNLIPNSALWAPGVKRDGSVIQSPNGNSYSKWLTSMNTVFGTQQPRFGYAANDDVILDLCGENRIPDAQGQFFRVANYGASPTTVFVKINGATFIKYETSLMVSNERIKTFHPAPVDSGDAIVDFTAQLLWFGAQAKKFLTGDVQTLSTSDTVAVLTYDIMQVGTPPAAPLLSKVGFSPASFYKEGKRECKLHAVLFGMPVFQLRGADAYVLKSVPDSIPSFPPNYFLNDGTVFNNNNNVAGFSL